MNRRVDDPQAAIPAWEPLSPEVLADQLGTYDRQRIACALARSPRGVTLFRHADVVAAAHDPQTFSSAVSARRAVPNGMDPPEHAPWWLHCSQMNGVPNHLLCTLSFQLFAQTLFLALEACEREHRCHCHELIDADSSVSSFALYDMSGFRSIGQFIPSICRH